MISKNTARDLLQITEPTRQRPGEDHGGPNASLREQLHEVMRFFHYSERAVETFRLNHG